MGKSIEDYQNAYKEITEILINNTNMLAIFVFGSIVTGDLWEESDIDLLAICNDGFEKVRDVYSEIRNVPVHIKFLSKESFKKYCYEVGKKGTIKSSLISSKLIYSIDNEVSELYQKILYIMDLDKEKWNLVYLGSLLKELGICKKYLNKGNGYTSYELIIRAVDNFSKLYLNINGYTVSKDSLTMACNLNDELNNKVMNLFYNEIKNDNIISIINFIEEYLEYNIERVSRELLKFIKEKNKPLSAYEIKNDAYFKNFNIKAEEILKTLCKGRILVKSNKEFKDLGGSLLALENVYSYKH